MRFALTLGWFMEFRVGWPPYSKHIAANASQVEGGRTRMEPQKIYESIRRRVIWLDLMPETILNVGELAENFKISRTSVKEALVLLQGES